MSRRALKVPSYCLHNHKASGRAVVRLGDLPPNLVPLRMREFRFSGSSVFWWMERSGILQNTVGRERGRGLVINSTMRSPVVVVKTPSVDRVVAGE